MTDDGVIRISAEELNSEENIERERQMTEAKKVTQVRNIGEATPSKSGSAIVETLLVSGAGLLGGLAAWVLFKVVDPILSANSEDATTSNLLFSVGMAVLIGTFISMVDAFSTRSGAKVLRAAGTAVPIAIGAGLVFGYMANTFYSAQGEAIFDTALERFMSGEFPDEAAAYAWIQTQLHFPRGFAWMLVGLSAGVTAGAVSRSLKRLALTSAGGAAGGFLGGFIFDYITGEAIAQTVGMGLTGLLVGLGMGAIEQATKSRWIEITAGGLSGKQFILYKNNLVIGSSPQADITLIKDPGVPSLALRIATVGSTSTARAIEPGRVTIDGLVQDSWVLTDQSVIQIGNTTLRFREKSGNAVPTEKINRQY